MKSASLRALASVLLVLSAAFSPARETSRSADIAFLTEGVNLIDSTGLPGPLGAFGPEAFPVVLAAATREFTAPVVAASRLGDGRVVAFGHHGFLETVDKGDSAKFLANSVHWASGRTTQAAGGIRVGIVRHQALHDDLRARGFDTILLDRQSWRDQLANLHVLCADSNDWGSAENHPVLEKFVRGGGGLLTAGLGWGWVQLNPGKSLAAEHLGNRFLSRAGIVWLDGQAQRTAPGGYGITTLLPATNQASDALRVLLNRSAADPAALAHASWIVTQTTRALPDTDTLLQPQLEDIRQRGKGKFPTAAAPLKAGDAIERLAVTLDLRMSSAAPPGEVTAHPASADFPGSVPASASRVTETLGIHTGIAGWHSTGLYAAPGEIIRILLPRDATRDRISVRIGCHTDRLWDKPVWSRVPEITLSRPLSQTETAIASPFGGLIYIEVPADTTAKDIPLTVAGGVKAPRFILGRTNPDEWKAQRAHPAPWAELETGKVILTVPSAAIRSLADPSPVLRHWDKVMDSQADLAVMPRERLRPERIVPDVQISAGYMHAGYPIMTHLDAIPLSLDLARLEAEGSWGHYHELGHNHQSSDWTFDGTVEVTVNLFTLHTYDKVLGQGLAGHRQVTPEAREAYLKKYFGSPSTFEDWKRDPFLALTMYIQMIEGFGWHAFQKTFADYRHLQDSERPANDDQKRDQWLFRFSTTVGKNLGPFFEAWKVPTSQHARESVSHLPIWLPEENFPANYLNP